MNLFEVYPLMPIEPVRGEGCFIYDKEGTRYLDFYGGHAVISIGHSHPHYLKRVSDQLNRLGFYSNAVHNPLQQQLADKLGEFSACDEYRLFLCNSGAEANENALKLASFYNGRKKVLTFKKGFHGRTSGAVAITDNPNIVAPFNSGHQVTWCTLNDIDQVHKELGTQQYAAVIVEGIQGVGGIYEPTEAFLIALRAKCTATDTVLIVDEIQSGYGRSGHFFAFQKTAIKPDIISVAKGMGNGFPIGGILIHPKFEARYGMLGTTFGGNHLACAAALAVLEVMQTENVMSNVKEVGTYLIEALKTLPLVKEVRGSGLMIGIVFDFPIKDFRASLLAKHRIVTGAATDSHVFRLLPPLNIQKDHVDLFLTSFTKQIKDYI